MVFMSTRQDKQLKVSLLKMFQMWRKYYILTKRLHVDETANKQTFR